MAVSRSTKSTAFIALACVPSVLGLIQSGVRGVAHAFEPPSGGDTFHFLHVGKTAGSAVMSGIWPWVTSDTRSGDRRVHYHGHGDSIGFVKRRFVHRHPRPEDSGKVFFWLRAPVHRFTSGWLSRFREGRPSHYHPWSEFERWAFTRFQSPNELACALSSSNPEVKQQAESVFQHVEHLNKPLARIFHSQETAREMVKDDGIAFVGRVEHFVDDWQRLAGVLTAAGAVTQAPLPAEVHEDPDNLEVFKDLNRTAVENLRKWYAADYEIIRIFSASGLADTQYLAEVDKLDTPPPVGEYSRYENETKEHGTDVFEKDGA